MPETAAEFLSERRDFLHVYVVRSSSGQGWDVVCRFDGTYTSKADAEAAAQGIRDHFGNLTDVRKDGRDWWGGPPWEVPTISADGTVP